MDDGISPNYKLFIIGGNRLAYEDIGMHNGKCQREDETMVKRDEKGMWQATVYGVTRKGFRSPFDAVLWVRTVKGSKAKK